ncbi:zinc finger BED domain-containing protein 1-like [Rhizophagus clarus]|uniref:Zinc finger BED domain-containing protein 1-like n=1 Tax=Rhizophagus clarus TaxID=94130 RepID=A0A8H3LGG3_9GLOM|nr:zinc finger BED domain-containing protein 1-like [Rhizophagus clarus]
MGRSCCVYCDCFWKNGSPQDLEAHFANDYSKVPADTRQLFLNHLEQKITEFHESSQISEDRSHRACIKAFVTLSPGYTPPSKDLLSGKLLSQETAVLNTRVIKELKNAADLTLSETIEEIIDKFEPAKFSAIVTDSGANIRNTRQIITEKYKNILNVRYMAHAINLISKDICSTSFANWILTKCNTIVTYFKKSHQGEEAKVCDVSSGGLKKWADTRWHTMYDCVDSIMRHKVPLEI